MYKNVRNVWRRQTVLFRIGGQKKKSRNKYQFCDL